MQESLTNCDHDYSLRPLAIPLPTIQQFAVRRDFSDAIHAQGLLDAWNEKQQRDLRVCDDVRERIQAIVTRPVRYGERRLIQHVNKTGFVATRRNIRAT